MSQDLGWDYFNHNSDERIYEIDTLMKTPPEKHTILGVKGFWRASKRICRDHIGGTYEPIPKKRDMSVTAQSLAARDSDNYEYSGDQLDINLRPLHYCDKVAIEQYVEWFNNDCDFRVSKYESHRISSNGKGKVNSKETKVNPKIVGGIVNDNIYGKEPCIYEFETQEKAREHYNKELKEKNKGRGPNKIKPNEDGFYEATIRSNKKIYSLDEIKNERKQGLTENNYRFYPCYTDIYDKSTLKWLLIYY